MTCDQSGWFMGRKCKAIYNCGFKSRLLIERVFQPLNYLTFWACEGVMGSKRNTDYASGR